MKMTSQTHLTTPSEVPDGYCPIWEIKVAFSRDTSTAKLPSRMQVRVLTTAAFYPDRLAGMQEDPSLINRCAKMKGWDHLATRIDSVEVLRYLSYTAKKVPR